MNEILNGTIANIMRIELKNGTEYGYTDFDTELVVEGVTYVPAPGLQKVNMTLTANAEVSNQELSSAWVDAPDSELKGGLFDSATIEVAWCSHKHPEYGRLVVFTGQLGEITWTEEGFKADIVSYMKNLELNIGNTFTANCRHSLFSQAEVGQVGYCGLSKAAYTFTGSISGVGTPKWSFTASTGKPDGYFTNGAIKFTSGNNAGLSAMIKVHSGDNITLSLPTAFTFSAGDTFEIVCGCDKTLNTCKTKFNNILNFGGFPHITPDSQVK
jgi:uncharacterized phage protein (TIGR02218 family)